MTPPSRFPTAVGVLVVVGALLLSVVGGTLAAPAPSEGPQTDASTTEPVDRTTDAALAVESSQTPDLTVEPSSVDFGTTSVGDPVSKTVTIRNDGSNFVNVTSISIEGDVEPFRVTDPYQVDETAELDGGAQIPPGLSVDVTVQFAPQEAGTYNASVTVFGEGGTTLGTLEATGTATSGPDATASPRAITFEETRVGEVQSETVTVRNEGQSTLRVSETRLRGDDGYDLASPAPFALDPGESEALTVTFAPSETGSQSALLEIRSNDPDQPVLPVSISNDETLPRVTASEQNGTRTVDVSVRNAQAGERVNVTVPSSADEANQTVDVQHIGFVPERSGNLSLNVTTSSEPLATTPPLDAGDNASGLRYINVTKSLSNEDIAEVRYRYRIPKDRVAELTPDPAVLNDSRVGNDTVAGPEAITMYRYVDGEWVEERTRHVRETPTHHVFVTTGDGFSEWTAAAKRPDISVAEADANLEAARVGENVLIQVQLTNNGGADGVFVTKLLVNGSVVEQREVTVPDGGTVPVSFQRQFDEAATYEVTVNGVPAGVVTVNESGGVVSQSPSTNQAGGGGDDGSGDSSGGGLLATQPVAIGAGALFLLAALGGVLLFRGDDEQPTESTADPTAGDDEVVAVEGFEDGAAGGTAVPPGEEPAAGPDAGEQSDEVAGDAGDRDPDGQSGPDGGA